MYNENTSKGEEVMACCITCCIILITFFLLACAIYWFPGWLCERIKFERISPHVCSLNTHSFNLPEISFKKVKS